MSLSPYSSDESINDWDACAPGTLGGLSQRLRADHLQRTSGRFPKRAMSLAAVTASVIAVVVLALQPAETPAAATKISCRKCHDLMPAFHQQIAHQDEGAAPISKEEAACIEHHLKKCGGCRKRFKEKYPGCPVGPK